jgi:hypothetical protein
MNISKITQLLRFGGLVLIGICAIIGLSGCASSHVPNARAANLDLIPNIPAGTKVALINAQPATDSMLIGNAGLGRSVHGNLHTWTDQAIIALKRTLEKKGVEVSDNSVKSLKVAITEADLKEAGSGWSFRCTVHFTIETSNGQIVTLVADNPSWKYIPACDGVIPKVALVTLNDERIEKFLAEP